MPALFILISLLILAQHTHGQDGYPSPTQKENILFYIQHNRGHNTYVYKANVNAKKELHKDSPVKVYRQLFEENGKIKPLTMIQETFAYGIKTTKLSPNIYQAYIVSLPDQKITISYTKEKPKAETIVNGEKIALERIFLRQTDGTSGMSTKIDYILFYGKNNEGVNVVEKIVIDK